MLALFLHCTAYLIQASLADPPPILNVQPRHVHLALGEVAGSLIVSWSTINKTKESMVEVSTGKTGGEKLFQGSSELFVDGGKLKASQWIHKVVVTGLKGETNYKYMVGSTLGWSDVMLMRTVPSGHNWDPNIVMFGDMGNENAISLPFIQRETEDGQYDAAIHVGDMAYDMAELNGQRGDIFMEQIQPIASMMPYMTCPGNHEWHYNFTNYKARFNMPGDENNNMFFSFDIGPVHFASISTEFYYFLNYGMQQVMRQYSWLENDLASVDRSITPWVVVYGHRPMYCTNADRDDCTKFETRTRTGLPLTKWWGLEPLLAQYGVDLAVWAHEHSYERLLPTYNRKVVPSPDPGAPYNQPRATVHITTGSAGCREKHDDFNKTHPDWSAFRSTDYGYSRFYFANSTHMRVQQVSAEKNGTVIDEVWIVQNSHEPFHSIL